MGKTRQKPQILIKDLAQLYRERAKNLHYNEEELKQFVENKVSLNDFPKQQQQGQTLYLRVLYRCNACLQSWMSSYFLQEHYNMSEIQIQDIIENAPDYVYFTRKNNHIQTQLHSVNVDLFQGKEAFTTIAHYFQLINGIKKQYPFKYKKGTIEYEEYLAYERLKKQAERREKMNNYKVAIPEQEEMNWEVFKNGFQQVAKTYKESQSKEKVYLKKKRKALLQNQKTLALQNKEIRNAAQLKQVKVRDLAIQEYRNLPINGRWAYKFIDQDTLKVSLLFNVSISSQSQSEKQRMENQQNDQALQELLQSLQQSMGVPHTNLLFNNNARNLNQLHSGNAIHDHSRQIRLHEQILAHNAKLQATKNK